MRANNMYYAINAKTDASDELIELARFTEFAKWRSRLSSYYKSERLEKVYYFEDRLR
jgi:hypothetical protein